MRKYFRMKLMKITTLFFICLNTVLSQSLIEIPKSNMYFKDTTDKVITTNSDLVISKYKFDFSIGAMGFLMSSDGLLIHNYEENSLKFLNPQKKLKFANKGEVLFLQDDIVKTYKIENGEFILYSYSIDDGTSKSDTLFSSRPSSHPYDIIGTGNEGKVFIVKNKNTFITCLFINDKAYYTKQFFFDEILDISFYEVGIIGLRIVSEHGKEKFVLYNYLRNIIINESNDLYVLSSAFGRILYIKDNVVWLDNRGKETIVSDQAHKLGYYIGQTENQAYFRTDTKILKYDIALNSLSLFLSLENITTSLIKNEYLFLESENNKTLYVIKLP